MSSESILDIALFVPNLIGYARYLLLATSLYFALGEEQEYFKVPIFGAVKGWMLYLAFYGSSLLLDAIDGKAARMFN